MTPFSESTPQAVSILKQGGIIAHPADTCYGLAADFMRPETVQRLQKMKGRDGAKPMSIMLSLSMKEELSRFAYLDDFTQEVCQKLLPGPVTLLLPKGPAIPEEYYPKTRLIGLRIPNESAVQKLLEEFGGALITTSANLSGQPPCLNEKEVRNLFNKAKEQPDLIIEGKIKGKGLPSTVILVDSGHLKIVRQGPVTEDDLKKLGFTD